MRLEARDRRQGATRSSAHSWLRSRHKPPGSQSIPTRWRGRPGKGAYPLPSSERGFRSNPDGSDSSSLWAAQPPLRQISSHRTPSPRPGPVFKDFCLRRRRLHSPVARPSRTLPRAAAQIPLPPH